MKSRLFKSWLRLLLLWWGATAVWWSMSDHRVAAAWERLTGHAVSVDAFNSGLYSVLVLRRWSVPVWLLTAGAVLMGVGVVHGYYRLLEHLRNRRVRPHVTGSRWRSIRVSMGELEKPRWAGLPITPVEIEAEGDLAARLAAMSEPQRAVLGDVLGLLAAHPGAFVGDGHQGTLLEHTLHVLDELHAACDDPLLPIAAAAHDAGKILAWQRDADGRWKRSGWHDDLGGLMLSGLPSMDALPESEARILITALRYAHKRQRTPVLPMWTDTERMRRIQDAITDADHTATADEKSRVLDTLDRATLLRRAFLDALPGMQFQIPGLRKGVQATGWRKGARVYLSEPRLREVVSASMRNIDANAAAAWSVPRKKGQLARQTADLIDVLRDAGWLVSEAEGMTADPPLWIVQSGTITLRGILIVDLPEDLHTRLPVDAPYAISIAGPLFKTGPKPAAAPLKKPERQGDPLPDLPLEPPAGKPPEPSPDPKPSTETPPPATRTALHARLKRKKDDQK